tara:strand:- start:217 stop:414 length:198 start_codon:yes stop_codon:yes gene_type:complete
MQWSSRLYLQTPMQGLGILVMIVEHLSFFEIKHRQNDIQYPVLFWSRFHLVRFDALAAAIFGKFD